MIDYVYDGLVSWFENIIMSVFDLVSMQFLDFFSLDLTNYFSYFPIVKSAFSIFVYVGMGFAIALLAGTSFASYAGEMYDGYEEGLNCSSRLNHRLVVSNRYIFSSQ